MSTTNKPRLYSYEVYVQKYGPDPKNPGYYKHSKAKRSIVKGRSVEAVKTEQKKLNPGKIVFVFRLY